MLPLISSTPPFLKLQRIQVERLTVLVAVFVVTVQLVALQGEMTAVATVVGGNNDVLSGKRLKTSGNVLSSRQNIVILAKQIN